MHWRSLFLSQRLHTTYVHFDEEGDELGRGRKTYLGMGARFMLIQYFIYVYDILTPSVYVWKKSVNPEKTNVTNFTNPRSKGIIFHPRHACLGMRRRVALRALDRFEGITVLFSSREREEERRVSVPFSCCDTTENLDLPLWTKSSKCRSLSQVFSPCLEMVVERRARSLRFYSLSGSSKKRA